MISQQDLHASWSLITDNDSLSRAAEALAAGEGPAGFDAERASGFRYGNEAYLVQVYRRGATTFLFDPTKIDSFDPLREALQGEEWILHAASQDLSCLAELDLVPTRLFDTELAARLLGFDRVGLGSIVEQLLGIQLEKAHSAADWSTRPLPGPWLEYAALDVALLPDLRDAIAEELRSQHKEEIAAEEFEAVRTRRPKPASPEPWRKLAGGNRLRSPRELAIARELWNARDALARERDLAPGRLLPDASIIVAAAQNPRAKGQLAANKEFRGRESRGELDRWWNAIVRGKTAPLPGPAPRDPLAIPNHRSWPQRFPEQAERLASSRAALTAEAERLRMPLENLLTPDTLRHLVWNAKEVASAAELEESLLKLGARHWQAVATAPILARVFVDTP